MNGRQLLSTSESGYCTYQARLTAVSRLKLGYYLIGPSLDIKILTRELPFTNDMRKSVLIESGSKLPTLHMHLCMVVSGS